MASVRTPSRYLSVCVLTAGFIAAFGGGASSKETVLYSFRGGSDGAGPGGPLIADGSGNLYGTTGGGGGGTGCQGRAGCGTVYRFSPGGTETLLHAFQGGSDGAFPSVGVIADAMGNLFGTTSGGGGFDDGTVFKITADGTESVLYAFRGGSDGIAPGGR